MGIFDFLKKKSRENREQPETIDDEIISLQAMMRAENLSNPQMQDLRQDPANVGEMEQLDFSAIDAPLPDSIKPEKERQKELEIASYHRQQKLQKLLQFLDPRTLFHSLLKSVIAVSFLSFAIIAIALYFYAYTTGLEAGQKDLPPIIKASATSYKVKPPMADGDILEEDLVIYNIAEGGNAVTGERRPANANGRVESLFGANRMGVAQHKSPSESTIIIDYSPTGDPQIIIPRKLPVIRGEEADRAPSDDYPEHIHNREIPKPAQSTGSIDQNPSQPNDMISKPPSLTKKTAPAPKPRAVSQEPTPIPAARSSASAAFMVQVAATRSYAQAQQLFDRLKGEHPDLLQGYDPLIVRADLGAKGVFMRVNVPGFASKSEAGRLCRMLKGRGQDCLVKRQE